MMSSNRTRLLFVGGSLLALVLLTALKAPVAPPGRDPMLKPLAIFTEVLNLTRSNYVEPVDVGNLLAGAYDGVTDAIDPFSYFVPQSKMARYEAFRSSRAAEPGLILGRKSSVVYVVAATPGSPAAAAGIRPGDLVLAVDGVTTRNQALWEVEARLRGAEGSTVELKMLQADKEGEQKVVLKRERSTVPPPSRTERDGIPVIRISGFSDGTAAALRREVAGVAGGSPLVLDVRGTATGDVAEAVRAASLFVPPGEVATLTGKKVPAKELDTQGSRVRSGRLCVLVDDGTAGAAEVFAGALHDRAGASLVGEPTAGMGIDQRLVPMSTGGALFLTVAEYRTPSGKELGGKPLTPDVRVDIFPEDLTGGRDPILNRAIELMRSPAPARGSAA